MNQKQIQKKKKGNLFQFRLQDCDLKLHGIVLERLEESKMKNKEPEIPKLPSQTDEPHNYRIHTL